MKKITIVVIVVFATMISFAQTQSSGHLTFKGVPVDGTLNEYVSKMKQSGFTLLRTENGIAMLTGDFAAYKDCLVGVSTLKQKDLVSKITVIFAERDTWSSLLENYFELKEMQTQKYGTPAESIEKFDTYSEPRNDQSKMYEVKMNNCKYSTTYETDKGSIQLFLAHDGISSCYVVLAYYDKINGDIIRARAMDDL